MLQNSMDPFVIQLLLQAIFTVWERAEWFVMAGIPMKTLCGRRFI